MSIDRLVLKALATGLLITISTALQASGRAAAISPLDRCTLSNLQRRPGAG